MGRKTGDASRVPAPTACDHLDVPRHCALSACHRQLGGRVRIDFTDGLEETASRVIFAVPISQVISERDILGNANVSFEPCVFLLVVDSRLLITTNSLHIQHPFYTYTHIQCTCAVGV